MLYQRLTVPVVTRGKDLWAFWGSYVSGFGKKGIGQTTPGHMPRPASRAGLGNMPRADEPQLSSQAMAFLANERTRTQQERPRPMEAGISDVAEQTYKARGQGGGQTFVNPTAKKSLLLAYVLWYFVGAFAAHRFYLRAHQSAWTMLGMFWGGVILSMATGSGWPITLTVLSIGWMVLDLFLIPGLARRANGPRPELAFS
jgi:TM2 domain-containing membrane protein YozV